MTREQLARLEWDWDLPPGFLVRAVDSLNHYGVTLQEVREQIIRAYQARAVLPGHPPIAEILDPHWHDEVSPWP